MILFDIANAQTNLYTYDAKGRLVNAKTANCKTIQYTYDADGNRTITQKSEIILSPTVANISCFGKGNGAIALNPNNTTYSYNWSNGATSSKLTNLSPGNFTVTITDALLNNQCVKTYTITQPPSLNASLIINNNSCYGAREGSASIDTILFNTNNIAFHWSDNSTGKFIIGLGDGLYNVTITNSTTNCSEVYPFSIISPPRSIQGSSKQDNPCFGDSSGYVAVVLSGALSNYNIIWSDGALGASHTNLTNGSYTVYTTQNGTGCSDSMNFTINSPDQIVSSVTITPSCIIQNTGAISIATSGGIPPYKYSIDGGVFNTSYNFTQLATGKHSILVRDNNLCFDSLVHIVPSKDCNTGVQNISENSISIYPSPNKGIFYIDVSKIDQQSNYTVTILDKEGKIVLDGIYEYSSSSKLQLQLFDVASGTYIVQLKTDKKLIGTSSIVILK